MTQREIELLIESWKNYIADQFKDIQVNANSLKYAEDQVKNNQVFIKITDSIDAIKKAYEAISDLEVTVPDEDYDDSNWNNNSTSNWNSW